MITKSNIINGPYHIDDYDYQLPDELIARYPSEKRSSSRLLVVPKQATQFVDTNFEHIIDYLQAGDVLVFNDTRVIKARLFAQKSSSGRVEILVTKLIDDRHAYAMVRANKPIKTPLVLHIADGVEIAVLAKEEMLYRIQLQTHGTLRDILEYYGQMPIPPYFARQAEAIDNERYQTVYAKHEGSIAAPTAGLHFDTESLAKLKAKGVIFAYVTLHVGVGTFAPVRVNDIRLHQLHCELAEVSQQTADVIAQAKVQGRRVIAIGTTSLRTLESAARHGVILPFYGETNLFIYPGFSFQICDALLTNFHLPRSSLLMLVSAFAGYDTMRAAYAHAVASQYRFFSYGDAMFIQ